MNKKILIIVIGIVVLVALIITGVFLLNKNSSKDKKNSEWNKVDIGKCYYESETIELDLDGDNQKEKIDLINSGKYIKINDKEYIVNKYYTKNNTSNYSSPAENLLYSSNYNSNYYYIVDLNNDGVLEIIHETHSIQISPISRNYTIYNYKNKILKEIGEISVIGSMPDQIEVKGNTIRFQYHPYESIEGMMEEVICELDV